MSKNIAISVNGGGALGIGPLAFMCKLEQDTSFAKSISARSFAFAGTSTGAIIAACLAEGKTAHDTFELYRKNLKAIFTKYPWYKRMTAGCPTYDNSNLKKLLQQNLTGNCSDWKKTVFITTTFMNGPSVEKVWDTGDTGMPKWKAVLSSTAAPTYFDVLIDNGNSYTDGGMWANDPIMTLQAGLTKAGKKNYKILSFNTGMTVPNTDSGNKTLLGWGEYILKNWVARAGMSNYYEACANIGEQNVFRVSPSIPKPIEMDDTSDKTVQKVIDLWEAEYKKVRDDLIAFVNK